jgi:hypothetical protein
MATPFKTPPNELSFSGLIDAAIMATGKPNLLTNAVSYANAVVRECQALGLFARDMIEDALLVPSDQDPNSAYVWTRPPLFRSLRAVKYISADVYPKLALPGRIQRNTRHYFYAADNYFTFKGACAGETIATATYYWSRRLGYYGALNVSTANFPGGPYDIRPAFYDTDEQKWQYLNTAETAYVDTTGDPVVDAARQLIVSNWLVQDWYDLILSGTINKILTRGGDPRSGAEFSNYTRMQAVMKSSTAYESEGFQ